MYCTFCGLMHVCLPELDLRVSMHERAIGTAAVCPQRLLHSCSAAKTCCQGCAEVCASAVAAPLMHQNSLLTLQGAGAYDAAVHCASVSAARRIQSHRGDTPTHAGSSNRAFDSQHPFTPRAVRRSFHQIASKSPMLGKVLKTAYSRSY